MGRKSSEMKGRELGESYLRAKNIGFLAPVRSRLKRAVPKTKFNRTIFFDSFRDVIRRGRK